MKKIISSILALCLFYQLSVSAVATSSQYDQSTSISYKSISEGKVINSVDADGISYKDILIDDIIVYSATYSDGSFEYAYSIDNNVYFYKYKDDKLIDEHVTQTTTTTICEGDLAEIYKILDNSSLSFKSIQSYISQIGNGQYEAQLIDGTVVVVPSNNTKTTTLNIGISDLITKYPAQNQSYSSTYNFYCSPLSCYKNIIIRDTRNSYVQTTNRSSFLSIGKSVVEIAATIWMSQANVLTLFDAYLVLGELAEALNTNRGIEATASRQRQGFIYDTTNYNAYVSVLTEYGIDSYAVTNQGSGYDWGEVPYTMKDLYPDSYIGSQSAYAYNNALEIYGLWPWGNV